MVCEQGAPGKVSSSASRSLQRHVASRGDRLRRPRYWLGRQCPPSPQMQAQSSVRCPGRTHPRRCSWRWSQLQRSIRIRQRRHRNPDPSRPRPVRNRRQSQHRILAGDRSSRLRSNPTRRYLIRAPSLIQTPSLILAQIPTQTPNRTRTQIPIRHRTRPRPRSRPGRSSACSGRTTDRVRAIRRRFRNPSDLEPGFGSRLRG